MVAKMVRRRWRSASARASCSGLGSTKLGATLRLSVAKVPSFTSMVAEQGIASADSVFAVRVSGKFFVRLGLLPERDFAVVPGGFYLRDCLRGTTEFQEEKAALSGVGGA